MIVEVSENLKTAYLVDDDGFILDVVIADVTQENDKKVIFSRQDKFFYKAKWNSTEWTEGATQEEIEELTKVNPSPPTVEQRTSDLEDIVNMILTGGI